MNELILVLVGISTLTAVVSLVLITRLKGDTSAQDTLRSDFQNALSRNSVELTSVMIKSTMEIRQDFTDRIHNQFAIITRELREGLSQTTQGLEAKFTTLEGKVSERLEVIGKEVQNKLDKNIQDGFAQFQKVQEMLVGAEKQLTGLNAVGQSIQELNNVLNLPHLRGKIIGEGNLERLLADFLPAGFYAMQYPIDGALVDAVIKFPHLNLVLPIDSKFSMEQVSALYDHSSNPEDMKLARKKLAEVSKQNAKDIKTKYIKPSLGTTDYALMYLPSETLYFEVIRDNDLWSALVANKVFPVSPNTLAITINSIGKSLQYYEMAKGVQKTISQIHTARDHLNNFKKRFDDIGDKLFKAQDSFQKATTHFSHYSSSVDKLSNDQDQTLSAVESTPAALIAPPTNNLPSI